MSQNINVDSLIKVKNSQGGYDTIYPITKAENVKVGTNASLAQKLREIQNEIAKKLNSDMVNTPNGFAGLDERGLIPIELIPKEFKEIHIVETIDERDSLTEDDLFVGFSVFVKDATGDTTVKRGGAYYVYDGAKWIKTAESESLDVVLSWDAIMGKPTTIDGYGITDAVNVSEVVDTATPYKILKLNSEGALPADVRGNADTATRLQTATTVKVQGDVIDHETSFDGSQELIIPMVLKNTGVTAGTYVKVKINEKGQVVGTGILTPEDIPGLDWSKIISGKPTTLAGYGIEDALNIAGGELTGHLTLHADPSEDMHAATKKYVDSVVQGLDVKHSVRLATNENIELSGLPVIDDVQTVAGDRILVKNQTDKRQNGIYVAQAGSWVRAGDANTSQKINPGLFTFVEEGTRNGDSGFVLTNNGSIVLGVTELEFSQFSGAGQIFTGVGLAKDGNSIYLTNTGVEAGTYTKVTVDAQGRVTGSSVLTTDDLPEISWELIQNKPNSSVEDIDDAVAKRHVHDNSETLDALSKNQDRLSFNGRDIAFADETVISAISEEVPENLSIGGMWFQVV